MSLKRYHRRKEAKQKLSKLLSHKSNVLIIHYSCESFYDREDRGSPRITTIAVRSLHSSQTRSFSIHKCAEATQIPYNQIDHNYNELEKSMLDSFYEFVNQHQEYKWVHWNMRDETYGFQAIAHRYRVLGGTPLEIHDNNLFDFSRVLVGLFGTGYIGHPRFQNIILKNHITDRDFLTGEEEATAFSEKEYYRIHLSTLRKVDSLENILERTVNGTLKHNARFREIYGGNIEVFRIFLEEHPLIILFSTLGSIASVIALFWKL